MTALMLLLAMAAVRLKISTVIPRTLWEMIGRMMFSGLCPLAARIHVGIEQLEQVLSTWTAGRVRRQKRTGHYSIVSVQNVGLAAVVKSILIVFLD